MVVGVAYTDLRSPDTKHRNNDNSLALAFTLTPSGACVDRTLRLDVAPQAKVCRELLEPIADP